MIETKQIIKTGVVSELNGKYWGEQYSDGHCTDNDFGPIEKADISNPEFCKKPTDMTWTPDKFRSNHEYDKLARAKLVPIKLIITYDLYKAEGPTPSES